MTKRLLDSEKRLSYNCQGAEGFLHMLFLLVWEPQPLLCNWKLQMEDVSFVVWGTGNVIKCIRTLDSRCHLHLGGMSPPWPVCGLPRGIVGHSGKQNAECWTDPTGILWFHPALLGNIGILSDMEGIQTSASHTSIQLKDGLYTTAQIPPIWAKISDYLVWSYRSMASPLIPLGNVFAGMSYISIMALMGTGPSAGTGRNCGVNTSQMTLDF